MCKKKKCRTNLEQLRFSLLPPPQHQPHNNDSTCVFDAVYRRAQPTTSNKKMAPLRSWAKRSVEEDSKQRGQEGGESAVRTRVRRVAKVVENAFSLSHRKEQQRRQPQQEEEEDQQDQQQQEDQQLEEKQQQDQQPLENGGGQEKEEKDSVVVDTKIDLRRSRTISGKEMNAVLQHREVIMERRLSLPLEHPRSIFTEDGHTDHEDSDSSEHKQKARPDSIE